jgi:hypothetical protein
MNLAIPRCWIIAGLISLFLLAFVPGQKALAQPFSARPIRDAIQLNPGASCLNLYRLSDAVTGLLSSDQLDRRISVEVSGDPVLPNVVSITIWRVHQAYATRRFSDAPDDCNQLHRLVALAIAFAIDATWLDKPEHAKKEGSVKKETPEKPELEPLGFAFGFDGAITSGMVPGFGFGGDLRLEYRIFSWLDARIAFLGVYGLMQPLGQGTVDSYVHALRLDACAGWPLDSWVRLRGCLGGAIGVFTTRGSSDFIVPMTDTTAWAATLASIESLFKIADNADVTISFDAAFPSGRRIIQVLNFEDPKSDPLAKIDLKLAAILARFGFLLYFP